MYLKGIILSERNWFLKVTYIQLSLCDILKMTTIVAKIRAMIDNGWG